MEQFVHDTRYSIYIKKNLKNDFCQKSILSHQAINKSSLNIDREFYAIKTEAYKNVNRQTHRQTHTHADRQKSKNKMT